MRSALVLCLAAFQLQAASWTPLLNKAPGFVVWPLIRLTDGTVMALSSSDYQTWYRLAPDAQGNYANGSWTQLPQSKMNRSRLDFASQVLPDGRLWVLGGEYSGPGNPANDSYFAEIFDPTTNTWSDAAPFPNISGCTTFNFGGAVTTGSAVMSNIISTAGWQPGWVVTPASGNPFPAGTTIASVDSPTQIHLSANATATGGFRIGLNPQIVGNTTSGSNSITGIASTTGLLVNFTISGPGIPSGAYVTSVGATSITISSPATATASAVSLTLSARMPQPSCAGDLISMLVPGPKILTGTINSPATWLYDPSNDSWAPGPAKVFNDRSAEEGWTRLADGSIVTYDISQSETKGSGYAERYDPVANKWRSISPADNSAQGTLPVLSTVAVGDELGPLMRLQDDRVFAIGGNGHTALYTPSTNTWAAGPDMIGTLGGQPFLYSATDAPAAVLPNGHVLLLGDSSVGVTTTGTTVSGSPIVTGIPSTAQLVAGWQVVGAGIPATTIKSIDSPTQVTLKANATASASGVSIRFGTTYNAPSQVFDFDPTANTISPVNPPLPDTLLATSPSYYFVMLTLPTGQVLLSDSSNQLWIYTPDGSANPSLIPAVSSIAPKGNGVFTLTGTQLNGQSAGTAYGDDEQMDTSFPSIRLVDSSGNVFYARTTNWSYIGIAGGATPQTVDFTLSPQMKGGTYSLFVSGAGLNSSPVYVNVSADLANVGIVPTISSVNDFASTRTSAAVGQFVAIYGQGLSRTTRIWTGTDFPKGVSPGSPLPTALDGVSVTIGGVPAAVYYVSPTQLDVQVPTGLALGNATVVVTNNGVASAPASITIAAASASFYTYPAGSNVFPVAQHLDGTLVGDPNIAGTPARPGEIIQFYVSGLAAATAGVVPSVTTFTQSISMTAGNTPLTVLGAALIFTGEFQVNAQLPATLAPGTYPLTLTVPGGSTSSNGVNVVLLVR